MIVRKLNCEETESHLEATIKNLNHFILKLLSKREKSKQKLTDLTQFRTGNLLHKRRDTYHYAKAPADEKNKYFE